MPILTRDFVKFIERCVARDVLALGDFGMGSLDLEPSDFLDPDVIVQLGYPLVRNDVITSATGVDLDSCWSHRATAQRRLSAPFSRRRAHDTPTRRAAPQVDQLPGTGLSCDVRSLEHDHAADRRCAVTPR